MIKYEIAYMEKKGKRKKRLIAYIEAENLTGLYKLLENENITHIIDIQEVK